MFHLDPFGWHIQLGDAGTLFSGLGILIAAGELRNAGRSRRAEARRQRQAVARLVSVSGDSYNARTFRDHAEQLVRINVTNGSDEPITCLGVTAQGEGQGMTSTSESVVVSAAVIDAMSGWDGQVAVRWHAADAPERSEVVWTISVNFVDRSGVAWQVDSQNRLTESTGESRR